MLGSAGSGAQPAMPASHRSLGHAVSRHGGRVCVVPIRVARRYVPCPSVRVMCRGGRRACRARVPGKAAQSARARQGALREAPLAVCCGERRLEVATGGELYDEADAGAGGEHLVEAEHARAAEAAHGCHLPEHVWGHAWDAQHQRGAVR
jgi:hypothetical protein